MSKFKITMESGGGTVYDFMSGFESEADAIKTAEMYDWHFVDENGFDWSLYIEEDDAE